MKSISTIHRAEIANAVLAAILSPVPPKLLEFARPAETIKPNPFEY
jgi:hypothetical protein